MAQDLSKKKAIFLNTLTNTVQAWYGARNQLKALAEEYNNNGDISGIVQVDIDNAVTQYGFNVGFMTPTYIANFMTVAQSDMEKILAGTAVTPGAPELIHYLRLLPS